MQILAAFVLGTACGLWIVVFIALKHEKKKDKGMLGLAALEAERIQRECMKGKKK
jgi:hypothetical protein